MSSIQYHGTWVSSLFLCALAGCVTPKPIGVVAQADVTAPVTWRTLSSTDRRTFEAGHAIFNTDWVPAGKPAGRADGLGPVFNAKNCNDCHEGLRRGRGPVGDGAAPADLVVQLGRRLEDGRVERGSDEYGRIVNVAAVHGYQREAVVTIRYEEDERTLPDGTRVHLRTPYYEVAEFSGPMLPGSTVLMPRMSPSIYGMGLLERVTVSELTAVADSQKRSGRVSGRLAEFAHESGTVIGRFGWQATEPTLATQTASAFSREMGLTTALISHADCGRFDDACVTAPSGGPREVEPALFEAIVFFQRLQAVPADPAIRDTEAGKRLFVSSGCADCHRLSLHVETEPGVLGLIQPYTDLLLHDLGPALADRDLDGHVIPTEWRTAPLWGLHASIRSGQQLRLLHDGRARTIEEAVMWHDGEAQKSRERFVKLRTDRRRLLVEWIARR